jgi:hypothetical protein
MFLGRSVWYLLAGLLLIGVHWLWGWVGFAIVMAFVAGFHVCYRLARGQWMPPED